MAGLVGDAEASVNENNTALAVGSGNLKVFATPMMLALMEEASCNALKGKLPEGYETVGMSVDIVHLAPTPINMKVKAKAKLINVDKRKLTFEVEAFDERERVGSGTHQRFLIESNKFMEKCNNK